MTDTIDGMTSTRSDRVGWYFYSWANHGYLTVAATVFLGPYLTSLAKLGAGCAAGADCRDTVSSCCWPPCRSGGRPPRQGTPRQPTSDQPVC
jgi:MFS-type transporter involved in bile tolerance (Atg22 family)